MCFGGSQKSQQQASTAPAPEAPDPIAVQQDVTAARRTEDQKNFGTSAPSLRVDRSATSGGVSAGGTGLRM